MSKHKKHKNPRLNYLEKDKNESFDFFLLLPELIHWYTKSFARRTWKPSDFFFFLFHPLFPVQAWYMYERNERNEKPNENICSFRIFLLHLTRDLDFRFSFFFLSPEGFFHFFLSFLFQSALTIHQNSYKPIHSTLSYA